MAKSTSSTIDQVKEIHQEALDGLCQRIDSSSLSDADKEMIQSIIGSIHILRNVVENRKIKIKIFLRRMFGMKTEKSRFNHGVDMPAPSATGDAGATSNPMDSNGDEKKSESASPDKKRKGGKGRNGRKDYPGATHKDIAHDQLKEGASCPMGCASTIRKIEDGIAYRWSGSVPISLVVYHLERFICHVCKTTFTATPPNEMPESDLLDPSVDPLAAKCPERLVDPSAVASLAELRFELGVPHYRLAKTQAAQGVPLAPSTQSKMLEPLRDPGEAVFGALEKFGANGELFINDDTGMRVLDIERGLALQPKPPAEPKPLLRVINRGKKGKKNKRARKRATTTAIISHCDNRIICLHYTGFDHAGTNLANLVAHRKKGIERPIQSCDGAACNTPKDFDALVSNCLDHARRGFYDVEPYFPDEISWVLKKLRQVYGNDEEAKKQELDPDERLWWHQLYSSEPMSDLYTWALSIVKGKDYAQDSPLRVPVKYIWVQSLFYDVFTINFRGLANLDS